MKVKRDEKSGLLYRPGTLDKFVIGEQSTYSKLLKYAEGKVVLDIGGNIGAFADRALKAGAKKVYSFEPEPDNVKLYKAQKLKGAKLYPAAVAQIDSKAHFYLNDKRNKGLHSLRKTRGRESIEVKTIAFEKILNKFKPEIIKIDIESGEYGIDFNLIPKSAQAIAVELHLNPAENRTKGKKLLKHLRENFHELSNSNITDKNWTTLFIGKRAWHKG